MTDHSPLERAARALCEASGDDWNREGKNGLKKVRHYVSNAPRESASPMDGNALLLTCPYGRGQ